MNLLQRRSIGAVLPLAILLLLAMLTFWLDRTVELNAVRTAGPVTHEPDYVVDGFSIKRLSENGDPRYQLTSSRMTHYPDDDSSHLDFPKLVQANPGKPETRVTAKRGIVSADGKEVRLFEGVELFKAGEKSSHASTEDIRVRTEYLRVVPDDDRADTPERVLIEQGKTILAGTGMVFDNRYRRIELQSGVAGTFERRK
jgi:lipopolysaccharide export system protein LptC